MATKSLLVGVSLLIVNLSYADNTKISLKCHNPPIQLAFRHHQTRSDGVGQASSEKVQFNINKPAVRGTIFVNEKNDGVCIATIMSDHIVKKGWASFNPSGTFTDKFLETDQLPDKPDDIERRVSITQRILDNKTIQFNVKRTGADVGNITLTFFVQYVEGK